MNYNSLEKLLLEIGAIVPSLVLFVICTWVHGNRSETGSSLVACISAFWRPDELRAKKKKSLHAGRMVAQLTRNCLIVSVLLKERPLWNNSDRWKIWERFNNHCVDLEQQFAVFIFTRTWHIRMSGSTLAGDHTSWGVHRFPLFLQHIWHNNLSLY
jgi:hypothetical protein